MNYAEQVKCTAEAAAALNLHGTCVLLRSLIIPTLHPFVQHIQLGTSVLRDNYKLTLSGSKPF